MRQTIRGQSEMPQFIRIQIVAVMRLTVPQFSKPLYVLKRVGMVKATAVCGGHHPTGVQVPVLEKRNYKLPTNVY